jgi:hypothetical protein
MGERLIEFDPRVHLFRGAPAVRSWSKYRETVRNWTLCGISGSAIQAVENPANVTCLCCLAVLEPPVPRKTAVLPRSGSRVASIRARTSPDKPKTNAASVGGGDIEQANLFAVNPLKGVL